MATWVVMKDVLRSILAFLGNRLLRQRFLATCMAGADRRRGWGFLNWKHKVIDWKWEYMEETFQKWSPVLKVFLRKFDVRTLKRPVGHAGGDADEVQIEAQCLARIEAAKADVLGLCAEVEAHAVFARACGRQAGWYTGCKCHDHILEAKDYRRCQNEVVHAGDGEAWAWSFAVHLARPTGL